MRVSIIVFPGSNCDHDVSHAFGTVLNTSSGEHAVRMIWHQDHDLQNPDLVVLPGGFSFGDYLRTGALAKLSPAMSAVLKFANAGGAVLGICNGFQILCEVGLLPGVLLRNVGCNFLSRPVHLLVEPSLSAFSANIPNGSSANAVREVITCPIAHGEGNYFADEQTLSRIQTSGQVVFRYCSASGEVDAGDRNSNPNGSAASIAGICNESGNVVGLMPHPERAIEALVGGRGGQSCLGLLQRFVENVGQRQVEMGFKSAKSGGLGAQNPL